MYNLDTVLFRDGTPTTDLVYNKREETLLCYYYPNTRVHKLSQNLEEPSITGLDVKGAILIIYKQPSLPTTNTQHNQYILYTATATER